jgi:transposase
MLSPIISFLRTLLMLSPIIKKLLRKSNQTLQKMINCLMNCFHIDAAYKTILYDTRQYRFKLQYDTALFDLHNPIQSTKQYKECIPGISAVRSQVIVCI